MFVKRLNYIVIILEVLVLLQTFLLINTTEANTSGPHCIDRYPIRICQAYEKRGLCSYVRKTCSLTCKICNNVATPAGWSEWTPYASCSVTCGIGIQMRTRTCNSKIGCPGSSVSNRRCNGGKKCDSDWGPWGPYGSCSVPCGGQGIKHRARKCLKPSGCAGMSTSQKSCFGGTCTRGQWTPWGKFRPCSVTCGGGKQNRFRTCRGGKNCFGAYEDIKACATQQCSTPAPATTSSYKPPVPITSTAHKPQIPASGWSPCSRTCGTGTRYKFDSLRCIDIHNPKCLRTFEECNMQKCPTENCVWEGLVPRYKSTGCCKRPVDTSCGSSFVNGRVIAGEYSKNQQWPWMVSLRVNGLLCGGTLIDKQWIVTAAHCIRRRRHTATLNEIEIRFGTNHWDKPTAPEHKAAKIILHPQHDYLHNDIALIKLKKKVAFSSSIQQACLPEGETPAVDSTCIAIGWGITDPQGPPRPAKSLMEVDLNILDMNVCRKSYGHTNDVGDYVMNSNRLLCAGKLSKRNDICEGDSGGPLLCQRRKSCAWYIAGIVSFGPKGTCGKIGSPGMFTKISAFERWIDRHVVFPKAGGCKK